MDRVPNRHHAIIDPIKVSDYLLSGTHPVGRSKAQFLRQFGFRRDAPEELVRPLLVHVRDNPVARINVSPYGKYRVEGRLVSPDGRNPVVGTVWIMPDGESFARFVTAFPC